MEKIRIGIIGVGQIGKMHLEQYAKVPGAEIAGVADINEAEARRVSEQHHIPFVTTDFRNLLAREDITAVDVCLHNNYHAPVTIAALEAGKNVYCEKPMAGSYVDAKAMLDTARRLDRKLSIQLFSLFTPETKAARRLIDNGQLGRIYHARSTGHRRRGRPFVDGYGTASFVKKAVASGGALYDMGVYHISQLLYLLGLPKVKRISGATYQEVEMDAGRRESSGFDVEELGVGFVRFADGATLDIIESWATHLPSFDSSSLMGSKGAIRLHPFSFHRVESDMDMDSTFDLSSANWRWHQLRPDEDAYDSSQHHWVAALQGRVPLLPTAEVALQTMLVSEGIYLSERLGHEVTADEVLEHSQSTMIEV